MWVSLYRNKCFWKRFTCIIGSLNSKTGPALLCHSSFPYAYFKTRNDSLGCCVEVTLLIFKMQISYTALNIKHSEEFAGNQGNHQKFVPSLLPYKCWLMFMGIEQKNKENFLKTNTKCIGQKLILKIRNLFIRENMWMVNRFLNRNLWSGNKVGIIKYFLIRFRFLVKTCNEEP